MLFADGVGTNDIFGFKSFDFISNPLGLRLGLSDMTITDHTIEIMKGVVWDYENIPRHLFLVIRVLVNHSFV